MKEYLVKCEIYTTDYGVLYADLEIKASNEEEAKEKAREELEDMTAFYANSCEELNSTES